MLHIAPLAVKLGKRPIWLGCMTGFFICHIWAACSKNYASLLVARLLASWFGMSVSPQLALAQYLGATLVVLTLSPLHLGGVSGPLSLASLNDLFFLHERGTQSGIQALSLSIGNAVAPVVSGFLIESKGWRWYHWLVVILAGVKWLLIFFSLPRDSILPRFAQIIGCSGCSRLWEW